MLELRWISATVNDVDVLQEQTKPLQRDNDYARSQAEKDNIERLVTSLVSLNKLGLLIDHVPMILCDRIDVSLHHVNHAYYN